MLWGDSYEEVVQFLRMQGYSEAEAAAAVAKMFEERLAIIRANGIQSIVIGSILVFVPVAGFLVLLGMNSISLRLLPIPLLFGIWGVWLVVKGVLMVFAPKSEMGDASRM
jgi:hypothetical protein